MPWLRVGVRRLKSGDEGEGQGRLRVIFSVVASDDLGMGRAVHSRLLVGSELLHVRTASCIIGDSVSRQRP